jgi:hypothetical protein
MSGVFQNFDPAPPHRRRVCTPRLWCRGRTHSLGGKRKTPDTALYSTYVSTLRFKLCNGDYCRGRLKPTYCTSTVVWIPNEGTCRTPCKISGTLCFPSLSTTPPLWRLQLILNRSLDLTDLGQT